MEETKHAEQPTTDRWPGTWQQEIFHELKMLVCVLAVVILVFQFAAQLIVVVGNSMYPTLHDGDLLVALRIHGELETGDIVVIHKETELIRETIIKRVIATGGQTVEIDYDNNAVYVDGLRLTEPYINLNDLQPEDGGDPMLPRGDIVRIQVPEGSIFVMGDNRNHSTDSRFTTALGLVDEDYVIGRAVFCFWPFGHIKGLED